MSGKLDQSLDEILTTRRRSNGPRRRSQRQATTTGRPTVAAPVGGVQKNPRNARAPANKPTPAKAAPHTGDSKIIVNNLPKDVNEQQIKEYFAQSVGSIKKVEISYGPNSVSRGIANVSFSKPDGASKAFNKLNGLLVDGRPIKIEIVVGASQAANVIPPTKTLAERTSQPKSQAKAQPKSAASNKHNAAKTAGAAGRGKKPRQGRTARPAKKTAEELDSEMADYFEAAPAGATDAASGAAVPAAAAAGDAPMDEIM
ncbi:hypothetical protein VD0002_g9003 [Verticillium dahliae]|uniref:RRM domain-containing protein n=3 Tax=Verticillium TaxID=1036719 RepID=G2XG77_VERDV|nr:uncharacterized protein VDAG_08864 [Verticillium dahliae VdLs.17]KAF3350379.1 Acetyl-CoA acetyltransferase [Verticillium dahliae VDG2]KAG7105866.1 mRNA export protein mlo3 like [Verticillium longisporum]KAH6702396.1 hypothetical protein EV126DRAFT_418131 [Verticillium dahliae]EGY18704.1 hypothetical protein VDAG_08864 [Verticillium dahliae VdLs.17]PNH36213.1 hypothetical protein BJF96_g277 [Verticillium dahliae]